MATSPSHKFGQIIGDLLEEIMAPQLQAFCDRRGLYLDKKGDRGAARGGKKVTWEDKFGNLHDIDFVIEKGGTQHKRGRPLAFIEAAWRRYTKHSRNKAQEIQGAILPIAEKYHWDKPFLGAILAGVFTDGSLTQMRSSGFEVMLFPYETITKAFESVGVNAKFDEGTPDAEFKRTVRKIEALPASQRESLKALLIRINKPLLERFVTGLEAALDRKIDHVTLTPLHGAKSEFGGIEDAIAFIRNYDEKSTRNSAFQKYEVIIRYTNGDKIDASFAEKDAAIQFLAYIANA
jgi:hypothetical protein